MSSPANTLDSTSLNQAIRLISTRRHMSREQARAAMGEILAGKATTPQIGMFLAALRVKGESVDEIVGFAQAIRGMAAPVRPRLRVEEDLSDTGRDALVDTAGTGGDASGTFNISTATALVIAGCGVRVAKHGNRSISTRCGSADVIEGLGVRIDIPAERVAQCIDEVGIGFMFAPAMNAAMKYAQPARRELAKSRTIFNLLGPLCNPAGATAQIVGVYERRLVPILAEALAKLGLRRGFVVHGADGLDEITTTGESTIAEVREGKVSVEALTPESVGLPRCKLSDLMGGDVPENVQIIRQILAGEQGPKREIVLMNSAAALVAAGRATDLREGVKLSAESIDSSSARNKLASLVEFTKREFGSA